MPGRGKLALNRVVGKFPYAVVYEPFEDYVAIYDVFMTAQDLLKKRTP